jgi:hypothetical protein
MAKFTFAAFLLLGALLTLTISTSAQYRDYMTDAEIELVRDAQDIDLRVAVLTRMADRRFAALGLDAGGDKKKLSEKWGPEPTGSRVELFNDISRLLEKAADDIDDIAGRNEISLEQNRMEGKLFPKAVKNLAEAAERYIPVLSLAEEKTTDEMERGTLLTAIEICEQVIEAATKLPEPVKEEKKKGKN